MFFCKHRYILLLLLFVMTINLFAHSDSSSIPLELSEEEILWLYNQDEIVLSLDYSNPPMNFITDSGFYRGITIDYLELISEKLNIEIRFSGDNWENALADAMEHRTDGILNAAIKDERKTKLNFTNSYFESPLAIAVQKGSPVIYTLRDLSGKTIAIVEDSIRIDIIRSQVADAIIVEVENVSEGIKLLSEGKVDAYFDDLPVIQHNLDTLFLSNLELALLFYSETAGKSHIGLRNDSPELHSIFNKAIDSITQEEHREILNNWFSISDGLHVEYELFLTEEEKQWLSEHPVIRVAADPQWAPIESINSNGTYEGISIDYLDAIEDLIGIEFEYATGTWKDMLEMGESGEIDIFSSLAETDERLNHYIFSEPYFSFPVVIYSTSDKGFIPNIKRLADFKVVLVEGYAISEWVVKDNPDFEIIYTQTISDALKMLRSGEADYYLGNIVTTGHYIKQLKLTDIKVAGDTPYVFTNQIGIRKELLPLKNILDKAIQSLPEYKKDDIYTEWIPLSYEIGINYRLIVQIGIVVLIVILLILIWNYRLSKEVSERTQELKEERQLLENLMDNLPGLFFLYDKDGLLIKWNRNQENILGYSEKELIGMHVTDFFEDVEDKRIIFKAFNKLKSEKQIEIETDGLTCKNGTKLSFFIKAGLIVDHGKEFIAGYGIDISDLREANTEKEKLEEQLIQAHKMEAIGTLAGGIAHDFNNILAAIIGFSELASLNIKDEIQVEDSLKQINIAGNRAKDLVKQILLFSRQNKQDKKNCSISNTLSEVIKFLKATLPATITINSTVMVDDDTVYADPTQLYQVILNICTNAVASLENSSGTIDIKISSTNIPEENDYNLNSGTYIELLVSDTGVGISKKNIDRIFDPFFTTKSREKGTGLGLSVVHGILQSHGAVITVDSKEGKGSQFKIYFPVSSEKNRTETQAKSNSSDKKGHILFVDDEEILCELNKKILTNLGYEVTITNSSKKALDYIIDESFNFDILITDKTMPDYSGIDLADKLTKKDPTIPIILCTGYFDEGHEKELIEHGICEILYKPISSREMENSIHKCLDKR